MIKTDDPKQRGLIVAASAMIVLDIVKITAMAQWEPSEEKTAMLLAQSVLLLGWIAALVWLTHKPGAPRTHTVWGVIAYGFITSDGVRRKQESFYGPFSSRRSARQVCRNWNSKFEGIAVVEKRKAARDA